MTWTRRKTALVTGGFGFIGSHLIDRLCEDGWTVIAIDCDPAGLPPHLERWRPEKLRYFNTAIHEVPVKDFVMFWPEVIFHLASPVGPVGVLGQAGQIASSVMRDAGIVRRWSADTDSTLIYVSTSEVYGSGTQDAEDDACHFQAATSARKEYAVAKLAAETMLRNTPGLDVRIIRPFNVAGPRQKADGGFVIPRFIAQARSGVPLTVYQPGTQRRAFGHVYDIVDGMLFALWEGKPGEVYNLGNPLNTTTMIGLAHLVLEVLDLPGEVSIVDPATLHGPAFREAPDKLPNIDKAVAELGWKPRYSLYDIIKDAALLDTDVANPHGVSRQA